VTGQIEQIKTNISAHGMSTRAVAKAAKVSHSTVQQILKPGYNGRISTIEAIAKGVEKLKREGKS
jgi:transcriptional regulator with XRE-family HTH domain